MDIVLNDVNAPDYAPEWRSHVASVIFLSVGWETNDTRMRLQFRGFHKKIIAGIAGRIFMLEITCGNYYVSVIKHKIHLNVHPMMSKHPRAPWRKLTFTYTHVTAFSPFIGCEGGSDSLALTLPPTSIQAHNITARKQVRKTLTS